jgi:chemotaxis protein methyltransferase CheR
MNRGLPARHVVRYFDRVGEDWVAKPEIRQLCNFRMANLCQPPLRFHERFDVIFLRNVVIDFAQDTRRTLMAGIHKLLAPDGVLLLGSAEQPSDPTLWNPVLAGGTSHFRPRHVV